MKTGLVLQGGGAKGAYEWGIISYLVNVRKIDFDVVIGTSVGALNGCMVAQKKYKELDAMWRGITKRQVYKDRNIFDAIFKPTHIFDDSPLYDLLSKNFKLQDLKSEFAVGIANFTTGKYECVNIKKTCEGFVTDPIKYILASASIPIAFPPVKEGNELLIDGGLINNNPIGDMLSYDVDKIYTICLDTESLEPDYEIKNVLDFAMRAFNIATYNMVMEDIARFQMINNLVQQAQEKGLVLKSPSWKDYRYIESEIIYADTKLCGLLDFDPKIAQDMITKGYHTAEKYFQNKD